MMPQFLQSFEIKALREIIGEARNVVAVCHVGPDGDAVGSLLATTLWLMRLGKQVTPVIPDACPDFLKWLPAAEQLRVCQYREAKLQPLVDSADLFIYLDFNSPDRMDCAAPLLEGNKSARRLMIDHHLNPVVEGMDEVISHPELSATCELLFRVMCDMGEYDAMTADEATCLYCGMMTDTGAFTYNSNRPEVFEIIGRLMAKGIDKDLIYRRVFHSWSLDRFRLMGYLLYVNWKYIDDLHTSIITLDADERRQFGYQKGDTEGIVNMPLQIAGTRLSVFLREDTERANVVKVSLRSVDDVPANLICQECFNGGGHLNAAGGEIYMPMEQAVAYVRNSLRKYARYLAKNA